MNLNLIREKTKLGDIILIGGDGWLSSLIKFGQKPETKDGKPSKWSHVMIYVDSGTVWESTIDFKPWPNNEDDNQEASRLDNGVQYSWLSNFRDSAPAMLLHFPFTDEQRQALMYKMEDMVKKGYTYPILGLVGSLLSYWIFRGWKSNPLQSKKSLYCSAAVSEVYSVLGINFDPKHTSRNTSPQAIANYAELHDEVIKYNAS